MSQKNQPTGISDETIYRVLSRLRATLYLCREISKAWEAYTEELFECYRKARRLQQEQLAHLYVKLSSTSLTTLKSLLAIEITLDIIIKKLEEKTEIVSTMAIAIEIVRAARSAFLTSMAQGNNEIDEISQELNGILLRFGKKDVLEAGKNEAQAILAEAMKKAADQLRKKFPRSPT